MPITDYTPDVVGGWIDGFRIVGGWWDGFSIAASTELTISIIALLVIALLVAAWPIVRRWRNTVEGHRVDWK